MFKMKKLFVSMATVATMMILAVTAFAADSLTININGSNNNVTIYGDGTQSQQQTQAPTTLSNIPSNARKVNIWAGGNMLASGYIVDDTVYVSSYEDVHRIFPSETKNWQNVEVQQATPLSMWADSFGYTFKVEANNVFLFKEGLANNSGELVTAKPAVVYVDGNRINVTVYLSDEDATVYAGLAELQKIFSANADKIKCSDVAQYTINYWANQFGYKLTIEDSVVTLTKKAVATATAETTVGTTATTANTAPATRATATSATTATTTTTASTSSKKYSLVVENTLTAITGKLKVSNCMSHIYFSKKNANILLNAYGKKTKVKKATEASTLAKMCGVKCHIKGNYVYFNMASNPTIEVWLNGKLVEMKGRIQLKETYVISADAIQSILGATVNIDANSKKVVVSKNNNVLQFTIGSKTVYNNKGQKATLKVAPYVSGKKLMLPLTTVVTGLGYHGSAKTEAGIILISITG